MPNDLECMPQQMSIVVLGSPSSGKTQIIRQFVECSFTDTYHPTKRRKSYYSSVLLNERVYQLALVDLPHILRNKLQLQEWENMKDEDAPDAYVFVFDLTNEESFTYLRNLRDQMLASLSLTPPGTVNNNSTTVSLNNNNNGQNGSLIPLVVMGNKYDVLFASQGHLSRRYLEMVNIIQKQWKWHYVECSAKHNWQVQHSFKTLTKLIDAEYYGNRGTHDRLIPGVLRRNRCVLC